jgi:hypothetical protein
MFIFVEINLHEMQLIFYWNAWLDFDLYILKLFLYTYKLRLKDRIRLDALRILACIALLLGGKKRLI